MSSPSPSAASKPNGTFIAMPTISAAPLGTLRSARGRGNGGFWRDAFRPFYLGGSIFAALAIFIWLSTWFHGFIPPAPPIAPLLWHMHEMVYGFAAAIIIGFLFTAARNWTGLPLPAGAPLAIVFTLWVAARVGMYILYAPITAIIDSSLLLIVAAVLSRAFIRAKSYTNMPIALVLCLLAGSNITFHLSMHGLVAIPAAKAVELGLFLVIMMELVIGSRIVPGFTASALPHARPLRSKPLTIATLTLAALALLTSTLITTGTPALLNPIAGTLGILAGVTALAQWLAWKPWATRARPILWILHLSYAWIPVGLILLGVCAFDANLVTRSAAIHALAAGSIGGLILGMITRTSLGHSGRVVRAGRCELTMYTLVILAALCRVAAAVAPTVPGVYKWGMTAAGVAWMAAFTTFAIAYAPMLLGRRATA